MGRLIDADTFVLALMDASLSSVDEDTILDLIDSIPTVDAVPVRRGKWIEKEDWSIDDYYYTCSVCGEDFVTVDGTPSENLWNFCPNCGADMREADHE